MHFVKPEIDKFDRFVVFGFVCRSVDFASVDEMMALIATERETYRSVTSIKLNRGII